MILTAMKNRVSMGVEMVGSTGMDLEFQTRTSMRNVREMEKSKQLAPQRE